LKTAFSRAASPLIAAPTPPRDRDRYLFEVGTRLYVSWVVRKNGGRRNNSRYAGCNEGATPGKHRISFLSTFKIAARIARELLIFSADSQHPIPRQENLLPRAPLVDAL
jgi:hypothetical protein